MPSPGTVCITTTGSLVLRGMTRVNTQKCHKIRSAANWLDGHHLLHSARALSEDFDLGNALSCPLR